MFTRQNHPAEKLFMHNKHQNRDKAAFFPLTRNMPSPFIIFEQAITQNAAFYG